MNNRLCTLTTVMQAIFILTYSVPNKDLLENKNYITLHIFLKTSWADIWSVKVMILLPSINIVYRLICLKNFLTIDNEVH
jgi:hypothetical protein